MQKFTNNILTYLKSNGCLFGKEEYNDKFHLEK